MFRQTPLTVSKTMPIVRRKGDRVRYFDPATARMSGWVKLSPAKPEGGVIVGKPGMVLSDDNAAPIAWDYSRMRKPELQDLARTRGIKFNTKTTADALREALAEATR